MFASVAPTKAPDFSNNNSDQRRSVSVWNFPLLFRNEFRAEIHVHKNISTVLYPRDQSIFQATLRLRRK